jgi:hypothetical protein
MNRNAGICDFLDVTSVGAIAVAYINFLYVTMGPATVMRHINNFGGYRLAAGYVNALDITDGHG